ncbi:hypothetical protein F8388_014124, partial [Cannabis sativa]
MYLCRYWRHIDKASKELSYRRENLKDLVEVPPAAMGVKVTVISTSPDKKEEAIDNLGADSFLVNRCHEYNGWNYRHNLCSVPIYAFDWSIKVSRKVDYSWSTKQAYQFFHYCW